MLSLRAWRCNSDMVKYAFIALMGLLVVELQTCRGGPGDDRGRRASRGVVADPR